MEDQPQLSPAELQAALLAVCSRHSWAAAFLSAQANSPQQLAQLCIKELAACRAAGRGELAVALVDAATAAGLKDPRLNNQRERAQGQQQGGALVRRDTNSSSALASPADQPRQDRGFWRWLSGFRGHVGGKRKRSTPALSGTPEQIEALTATCRAAGWSPSVITSEAAAHDLPRVLLCEMRACSEAGHHQLVVQLAHEASSLGIQHPRLRRARRQAQALLDSVLLSQLKTAIELREQGQPAASLALLDAALNAGHSSPWIHDNRARALVDLGRHAQAIAIWEQLQSHDDPTVLDAAQQMLQLQLQQLLLPLHDTLLQLANQHAWTLRHLGDPASLDLGAYTTSLLKEAIDARDNGHPDLSLAILDAALAAGLTNPWLLDNRARALVHRNQLPEAVAIWQQLCHDSDDALRATAHDMVQRFGPQAHRQVVLTEADQLLQTGARDQAIQLLTDALLSDPQSQEIQGQLQQLLAQRNGTTLDFDDDSSQELEPHRRGLLAFTEVLNTLEQRLHSDPGQS
jgi:tetratricopeptide (TPR) repeat protein